MSTEYWKSTNGAWSVTVVEAWFAQAGATPDTHRVEAPDGDDDVLGWRLVRGSASVFLTLLPVARGTMLQIHAPILRLTDSTQRGALFEEMLRLNATTLSGCCLGIDDDDAVIVITDRLTDDLSVEELGELVESVSSTADHYDDVLAERFGAEMIGAEAA